MSILFRNCYCPSTLPEVDDFQRYIALKISPETLIHAPSQPYHDFGLGEKILQGHPILTTIIKPGFRVSTTSQDLSTAKKYLGQGSGCTYIPAHHPRGPNTF
jgi:hypothetical protein